MRKKKTNNLSFYIPLLLILTMSILIMYHARLINDIYKNHFLKQSIFFLIGIFLLRNKEKWASLELFQYSPYLYWLNLLFLILVLFFGSTINGAKAWFHFGFFSFQPSELMKLSLSLYLTEITTNFNWKQKHNKRNYLCQIFILFLFPSILVFLEPDTGAILFYFLITLTIALSSKIPKKWFFYLFLLLLIFISGFFILYFQKQDWLIRYFGTSFFYRVDRLLNFQKGMQIENALIAIGSAPLFQINLTKTGIYIPESPTDFVFSLAANVFGITGNIIILICYILLDIAILKKKNTQKKDSLRIFTNAFLTSFLFNQIYNIFMNIGLVPIMGIPLPFLSYGGSTTIVSFLFLSIILNSKTKLRH